MPYVSSVERIGIAKGRAIGKAKGIREGKIEGRIEGIIEATAKAILVILENRLGAPSARLRKKVLGISDEVRLTNLIATASVAKSLGDFEAELNQTTA